MSRKLIISLVTCVVLATLVVAVLRYRFWVLNDANVALKTGEYQVTLQKLRPWALLGDSDAQSTLGLLYALGWGTPKDDTEAIKWFRRAGPMGPSEASEQSVSDPAAPAMYYVGRKYLEGEGIRRDEIEARKWFERSAQGGYAKATEQLAQMQAPNK